MIQIKFTCPLEYQSEVKALLLAQGVRVDGIETRYFDGIETASAAAQTNSTLAPGLKAWLSGDGKFPSKRLDLVPASGDSEATGSSAS
jgi:hypothetical protein